MPERTQGSDSSTAGARFEDIVGSEQGLRKTLRAGQITMIAIGGAIGTGLFLGSAFAIGTAGPSVLISYAIGAVLAMLLMGALGEMTVAHPTPGSFGAYAGYYVGPLAGFLVRYCYWAGIVLAVGTEVTAVGLYMRYWFPSVPSWYWVTFFSAVLIGANALSVRTFGWIEYWFSMVKITAIVAFVLVGAYVVFVAPAAVGTGDAAAGFHHYTAHGGFFPKGFSGTWVAVLIAIFSYVSIEMIAVAAGEAEDPERAVRSAVRSTLLRLVLFYLLTLALMLAIVPWNAAGAGKSPFVTVMEAIGIPGAAAAINAVVLVAALSAMNSQLYISSRMMFSLARAGYAPRSLGELDRSGVPLRALLLSTAGMGVAMLINVLRPDESFTIMLSLSLFGALFTWLMIFVTHWFFRRRWAAEGNAAPSFRMPGFPFLTLLGIALMLAVMITTAFTAEFHATLYAGVPFVLLLVVVYAVRFRGARPAN